jgi:anti-sigma factor RsiW
VNRICSEVQQVLAAHRDGRLHGWRARAVRQHLRRCEDCQAEVALLEALAALRPGDEPPPPPGLLADLLAAAAPTGVWASVAGPARGAVSGARPALSAAMLVGAAAAGTGVGWGVLRGVRRVNRLRGH